MLGTITMAGVNAELFPLVRMTVPEALSTQSIFEWPVQETLFSSWILLFGFLPIDRHAFYLEAVDPDSGFSERSSSWVNTYWCHRRDVAPSATGCRVTDTLEYQSRIPFIDVLFKPAYRLVFWCRHQHLRRRYAGRAA